MAQTRLITTRRPRGFTLVEIAVALAITAGLLVLGVPNLSQWIQNSKVRNAAESIATGLQVARAESVRRNTRIDFTLTGLVGGGTQSDWTVTCTTPTATCPGAGQSQTSIQTTTAAEGATGAVVTSSVNTITYNALGRLSPTPANDLTIDIANPDAGTCAPGGKVRCQRVVVSTTGQVMRCDPALAANQPGSC